MQTWVKFVKVVLLSCFLSLPAIADDVIPVGPWEFDPDGFADLATVLEPGILDLFGTPEPLSLDEALTGYSPHQGLLNIGMPGRANDFQLDFVDMPIVNVAGPDFVFFEARFSSDSYNIAVRPAGGGFTPYLAFSDALFVATGEVGPHGMSDHGYELGYLYGLPIDLNDFGLAPGVAVNSIRFRAGVGVEGIQGDPVMAAALVPEPATLALLALGAFALIVRRPATLPRPVAGGTLSAR